MTVPAHMSLRSYFDVASKHVRRHDEPVLVERLLAAGYTVEYVTPFMMALFPLLVMGRWLNGRGQRDPGDSAKRAAADLTVVPIVNRNFCALLWPDAWAVAKRRRLPLGTSFFAVGKPAA